MWNGPKSAWKALYSKVRSTEKYTGCGWDLEGEVGPAWAFAERLLGDLRSLVAG